MVHQALRGCGRQRCHRSRLGRAAAWHGCGAAPVATCGLDTRGGTRDASLFAALTGSCACARTRCRASTHRAGRARVVSERCGLAMQKSARLPLTRAQTAWLAALLLSAQLPLWMSVLDWVALVGTGLVILRLLPPVRRLGSTRLRALLLPALALVAALGIRAQFGYFLARDPCVEFLYLLIGIKFLEARDTRDGSLLVCLALFLAVTQFFYTQSLLAALLALPVVIALGGTLASLRAGAAAHADWRAQLAEPVRLTLQGIPIAIVLFILFPRLAGPLWGTATDTAARTGLSERMAPGSISELSLSDAVAFRVDFIGPPPSPRD